MLETSTSVVPSGELSVTIADGAPRGPLIRRFVENSIRRRPAGRVRFAGLSLSCALLVAAAACSTCGLAQSHGAAPAAPSASGARILLLPRKIVSGEHATLAVLDVNGRLTPGGRVNFSDGDRVTTETTGRALFVGPLDAGLVGAFIHGRPGRVNLTILSPTEASSETLQVTAAPRVASLTDRFELAGRGVWADADANNV